MNEFEKYFDISTTSEHNLTRDLITKYHYNKLYDITKRNKIKYLAMQYPTLSIEPVINFFPEDNDITFVSNEDIFKKALKNREYHEYFIDNLGMDEERIPAFKGNFGHTTAKGSRLIAENVANAILQHLNITN